MNLEQIGRYRIRRLLGRGGAAVVFLATDPIIEREVALKTLRVDPGAEGVEERRALFLREVRAVGRLRHPGIVTVYDVGDAPEHGLIYIAMEYVDGNSLRELIAGGARFPQAQAVALAIAVAEALDYAHFQGVVHRDVKPANLLVTSGGDVKITDFGVAKLDLFDFTFGGRPVGTPYYMSPELIRGRAVDARSDLFSLGLVLFELLTGQRPFAGRSILEVSEALLEQSTPDPSALCPGLPAGLCEVVITCLAKAPEDRFPTCGELARALRGLDLTSARPAADLC
jgi:eukaryotic-like serine/threonine-protein kinase